MLEKLEIEFPKGNYDFSKVGDMALYLAHLEFFPFKSVIKNSEIILNANSEYYRDLAETGDFHIQDWALTNQGLHEARVTQYTYYSLLITLISIFEEALSGLCVLYSDKLDLLPKYEDFKSKNSGVRKQAEYLEEIVGIKGFTSDEAVEYIKAIIDARNAIVHNGGRIKSRNLKLFDKYKIGYYVENNQLYLEYENIVNFYEILLGYIERTFKME